MSTKNPKDSPQPDELDPETKMDEESRKAHPWKPADKSAADELLSRGLQFAATCQRFNVEIVNLLPAFTELCVQQMSEDIPGPMGLGELQLEFDLVYARRVGAALQMIYPVELIGGIEYLDPLGDEFSWMACRKIEGTKSTSVFAINLADSLGLNSLRLVSRAYIFFYRDDDYGPEIHVEPEGSFIDRSVIRRPMLERPPTINNEQQAAAVIFAGMIANRNPELFRISPAK